MGRRMDGWMTDGQMTDDRQMTDKRWMDGTNDGQMELSYLEKVGFVNLRPGPVHLGTILKLSLYY